MVWFIQSFYDLTQVSPEVGAHRYREIMVATGGYAERYAGVTFSQFDLIQVDEVIKSTDWQAEIVGVVDAKMQHEMLLQQFGFDHIDINQAYFRGFEIA